MKQLLIILLFPIAGLGQAERIKIDTTGRLIFNEIDSTGTTQINYDLLTKYYIGRSLTAPSKPVMDTAIVMIVYGDTSLVNGGITKMNFGFVVWQFGYEVTTKTFIGVLPMQEPYYRTTHIAYLDEKKKPLSKSIVVIQTIKL